MVSKKVCEVSSTSAFFSTDHLTGRARCWQLHITTMYSMVFVSARSYFTVSDWFATLDTIDEDWQTFFSVVWYLVICAPIAICYQALLSGNRIDSTPADCWLSAALSTLMFCTVILNLDSRGASSDTIRILESICVAGFGIAAILNACFAIGLERYFPRFLGRHHEELRRARRDYCRNRLKRPPGSSSEEDTPATVFLDPRLRLEPVDVSLRKGARVEDVFAFAWTETPLVVEKEDEKDKWKLQNFLGRPKPWPFGYLRRSRPPVLYVSALVSLLLIGVIAHLMLIFNFRTLRRIASDLDDISRYLEKLDDEDTVLQEAVNSLDRSAFVLTQIERDWNLCWSYATGISLAIMTLVTCTIVPRFDRATELVKAGIPLHLREGGGSKEALVGQATALFGATCSVASIGLLLNTYVISCFIYIFVSDMIREVIWRFRYFIVSLAISFIIKGFVLQPYIFHKAASDGHRLVRFNLFMMCDIAWTAYNVIIGATIALIRAGYYVLFVVSAVAILDYTILPPSLSVYDTAHNAFVAAVWAHHRHHNPVLHIAVETLQEDVTRDGRRPNAVKRWHLAYTLLNNPKIIQFRKTRMATNQESTTTTPNKATAAAAERVSADSASDDSSQLTDHEDCSPKIASKV